MNNWTEVHFHTNFEGIYSLQINFQNNPKIDLESTENAYFPYYFLHSIRADDRNFRRFFINHLYAGCAKDIGWLVVAENLRPRCSWEKNGEIPVIKYATGHTKENWTYGKVKFADAILIFVKVFPVSPFVVVFFFVFFVFLVIAIILPLQVIFILFSVKRVIHLNFFILLLVSFFFFFYFFFVHLFLAILSLFVVRIFLLSGNVLLPPLLQIQFHFLFTRISSFPPCISSFPISGSLHLSFHPYCLASYHYHLPLITLYFFLSLGLSDTLSVYLSICLYIYLSLYFPLYLSLSIHLFMSLYLSTSLSLSIYFFISIYLSTSLSLSINLFLYFSLSIHFPNA